MVAGCFRGLGRHRLHGRALSAPAKITLLACKEFRRRHHHPFSPSLLDPSIRRRRSSASSRRIQQGDGLDFGNNNDNSRDNIREAMAPSFPPRSTRPSFRDPSTFCRTGGRRPHRPPPSFLNIPFEWREPETSPTRRSDFFPCTPSFGERHLLWWFGLVWSDGYFCLPSSVIAVCLCVDS
jgi:hypothetical protein